MSIDVYMERIHQLGTVSAVYMHSLYKHMDGLQQHACHMHVHVGEHARHSTCTCRHVHMTRV